MNIDRIKEIQKETICPESKSIQQALLKVWNECAQDEKPVDCNECWNNGCFENDCHCGECFRYKGLSDHFKARPKEWYEDESNFPCLCWISNTTKNPKEYISIIDGHNRKNRGLGAFSLVPGGFVKFATPLTKEEVLKYCVGEK